MEHRSLNVAELAAALRATRIFDLEHPRQLGDPVYPAHRPGTVFTLHRRHEPGTGERRTGAAGMIFTAEHAGTHIDAFCHMAWDMTLCGDVPVTPAVQTSAGFTRLGIDTVPPIVAHGVMLDLAAHRGVPLPVRALITVADLEQARDAQKTTIAAGDIVLVRTGNDTRWASPEHYLDGAGVSGEASEWLADHDVLAVGADNMAWDLPGHLDPRLNTLLPGHVILLVQRGIYIIENLNLAELSAARCLEFIFVCLPLKVRGGTASPVRSLAIA